MMRFKHARRIKPIGRRRRVWSAYRYKKSPSAGTILVVGALENQRRFGRRVRQIVACRKEHLRDGRLPDAVVRQPPE
jgi:hypothetical protein